MKKSAINKLAHDCVVSVVRAKYGDSLGYSDKELKATTEYGLMYEVYITAFKTGFISATETINQTKNNHGK